MTEATKKEAELHQLLAVEGDLQGTAKRAVDEAGATFSKRTDRFVGFQKVYEPFDEGRKELESLDERTEMDTTVFDKVAYVLNQKVKYWNARAQKDATNQTASADVIFCGEVIMPNVPATYLLTMESEIDQLRKKMFSEAPTLPPGVAWELAPDLGPNVYRRKFGEVSFRTQKTLKSKELHPGTKEHPPKIETWYEDDPIGRFTRQTWSGMIPVSKKAEVMSLLDDLEAAFKQARMRANSTKVVLVNPGEVVRDLILAVLK